MLTLDQLLAFLLAASLITMSPGPDNLMVLSLGMSRGRKQGMAFGLGCALGCLSHTLLAVVGVSSLLVASPVAFAALRIGGGAYLFWLGVQALRSRGGVTVPTNTTDAPVQSALQLLWRGVLANAINPKVMLFFLACVVAGRCALAVGATGGGVHGASRLAVWCVGLLRRYGGAVVCTLAACGAVV
jgi:threonine/homoserine/homoserine lactone efflux protein